MRIISALLIAVSLTSATLAFSDIGLIKKPKTLSYFALYSIDRSLFSSGLVYNQKQNEKMALEVSYLSYNSIYLLTRNVTKIRIDEKYKLAQLGPVGLTGLAGCAVLYAPSVGGGLAGDLGGILTIDLLEGLAAAIPLNILVYSDGSEMNLSPTINYNPGFWPNSEIYGGGRIEAQMVGGFNSQGSQGGKINFYLELGYRAGL